MRIPWMGVSTWGRIKEGGWWVLTVDRCGGRIGCEGRPEQGVVDEAASCVPEYLLQALGTLADVLKERIDALDGGEVAVWSLPGWMVLPPTWPTRTFHVQVDHGEQGTERPG